MVKSYLTVDGEFENLIVIEKSKFICYLSHVENEEEACSFLEYIRKKDSLSDHNTYAYIADADGAISKCSDDGEPQGTAGVPMLEALKSANLRRVIAVCTRFFGGIKLGTGGLSRAYSNSVAECIKKSKIVSFELSAYCTVKLNYDLYSVFLNFIKKEKCEIIKTDFNDYITIDIVLPFENFDIFSKKLNDCFNGERILTKKKEDFFAYKVL